MAEQVVQMTAHCPKNIVQFKSTIYVLMMHQVDLFPITMLFCHINSKSNKMNCELMLTYDTPALWQTGSRNLTGQKTLPTIWHTYMKFVTKYQIPVINSC